MDIHRLLKYCGESRASDIHLTADSRPIIRVDGALITLAKEEPLTATVLSCNPMVCLLN